MLLLPFKKYTRVALVMHELTYFGQYVCEGFVEVEGGRGEGGSEGEVRGEEGGWVVTKQSGQSAQFGHLKSACAPTALTRTAYIRSTSMTPSHWLLYVFCL